jgi:glutathione S-transferase
MEAKVYGIPGSHPVRTARLMLDHKGIPYKLVQVPNVACRPVLRAMGFPQGTVPAIKLDGRKLQRTRDISRALDEIRPEPPLFPADAGERVRVEEAERWGDEVFQPVPRRVTYSTPMRRGAKPDLASFFEGPLMGLPPKVAVATAGPLLAAGARVNSAADDAVRADIAALPGMLDRVDSLIEDGVIGGAQPNAADFQIAPTVRLLLAFDDLRPAVEGRPAADFAMRVCPEYPGHVSALLPAEWLAPLR